MKYLLVAIIGVILGYFCSYAPRKEQRWMITGYLKGEKVLISYENPTRFEDTPTDTFTLDKIECKEVK